MQSDRTLRQPAEDTFSNKRNMQLSDLSTGQCGVIVRVAGHGGFRKRIVEMGFVKGKTVKVVLNAPLMDPIEYEIMGYKISLRREEAQLVEVISESEAKNDVKLHPEKPLQGLPASDDEAEEQQLQWQTRMKRMAEDKRHVVRVALVGNPNCGKTSLFNVASGEHEHVGNYSGVTVDAKIGHFDFVHHTCMPKNGCNGCCAGCKDCAAGATAGEETVYHFQLVDLPGTYSLTAYSPEELYVRKHLIEEMPDVVINVVDASNLERNLYLTTQLIDMHQRMVVALNMYDELERKGDRLDHAQLSALFGVPMVPTISRTGQGLRELFETVIAVYESQGRNEQLARHIHINHGPALEQAIDRIKYVFQKNQSLRSRYSTRFLAIKFLEGDAEVGKLVEELPQHDELVAERFEETKRIKEELHENPEGALTDAKYGFVQGALLETFQPAEQKRGRTMTERIDRIVTHRWLGFPLFFATLMLIFYATFELGAYPMEWIEWLVDAVARFASFVLPEGLWRDMVVDGAIGGVGAVIVFLPNILILYLFISLLEDSGYMARAAFIMDKLMHRVGLHGKSFIPLVMGFGCNVPAVMATRTIENRRSRLVTMLVLPFMSCSARIPVYVVLVGAFFPAYGAWVMLGLYVLGIVCAIVAAKVLGRSLSKRNLDLPFVMELPPYRLPSSKSVLRHTWEKGRQYLRKMGGLILVFSLIIWALGYFPRAEQTQAPAAVAAVQAEAPVAASNGSYLERLGRVVSPVFAPMDFDWRMSVGIISGVGAKELVVSTLAVMYSGEKVEGDVEENVGLTQALRNQMTPATALAFLVFVLLYFPCIATLAAIRNESGGWKWALFVAVYTTVVAYVMAWATFALASRLM